MAESDEVYKATCRERDKNYPHKDDSYVSVDYGSISEIADTLKQRLLRCFELCKKSLPERVTLDFIDYDRDLYRFINKIDPETEEKILKAQHPGYEIEPTKEGSENVITKKIFSDTEDIKIVDSPENYACILKDGLTFREGLQERQDGCIRINVLYGKDIWVSPNMDLFRRVKKMIEEHQELPFLY